MQWVTGSGKTFAYLLPAFSSIDNYKSWLQVLIIVPTRELAVQVSGVAEKLTYYGKKKYKENPYTVRRLAGPPTESVLQSLKNEAPPHVLIATPTVAKVVLSMNLVSLKHLRFFVLDEVDELLKPDGEHEANVSAILKKIDETKRSQFKERAAASSPPAKHVPAQVLQQVYVSATITDPVLKAAQRNMKDMQVVSDVPQEDPPKMPDTVQHYALHAASIEEKVSTISKIHAAYKPKGCMLIFATEGSHADAAIKALRDRKFRSALLTAKIPKERKARASLHRRIKRGEIEALVITEMGARGLDVPRLELAINLD
eukprot:gene2922-3737_t